MGIIAWLVVGLIAGFLASKIVNKTGGSLILDLVLGIVGAMVGGFVCGNLLHLGDVTGINIMSIVVATVGAIIVLFIYHAVTGRRGAV